MPPTVLALMAHPDDAELLCAGVLTRLRAAGWCVTIATMTAGDCGTTSERPQMIAARRIGEATKAAAMLGADYTCLHERDGFVVYDKPTLRKVIELFRATAPALVLTHAPRDYMVDHEMASLLARSASFMFAAPNASTARLRPGSAVPHLYYCDPVEGTDPLGNEVAATTLVDVSAVIEQKAALLACHESQREWLRAHHGMDEYIESMKRHSARRGEQLGVAYAEGFVQHRGHAYPKDDLLTTLLGKRGTS